MSQASRGWPIRCPSLFIRVDFLTAPWTHPSAGGSHKTTRTSYATLNSSQEVKIETNKDDSADDLIIDNADLIDRARKGDKEALQQVCGAIEPRLRQAAAKKLGNLQAKIRVSDVLQSTFIDILRASNQLPAGAGKEVEQWSLRVLDNNIRDLVRYFHAVRRDKDQEQPLDTSTSFASGQPSPATQLVQSEDVTQIAMAIRELPEDYQRVLQLFMRPDFSHKSAASTLGRSEGATRVLLARARAALLASLDEA